jgi:hypothetical protein
MPLTLASLAATLTRGDSTVVRRSICQRRLQAQLSASEVAFLAFGVFLGVGGGFALLVFLRRRPRRARQVKVTVVPNAIPARRSATLSEDAFSTAVEPARGGPADALSLGTEAAPDVPETPTEDRTIVRSQPLPPAGAGDPLSSRSARRRPLARRIAAAAERTRTAAPAKPFTLPASLIASEWGTTIPPRRAPVGIAIESEVDWTLAALRAAAARTAEQAMVDGRVPVGAGVARHGPIAALRATSATFRDPRGADVRRSMARALNGESFGGADTLVATAPGRGVSGGRSAARREPAAPIPPNDEPPGRPTDPCSPLRRIADERCAVATGARARAATAADALAAAQHAYDEHIAAAERAAAAADQRSMRSAKEAAQQVFRDARAAAHSKEAVEAAARDWLTEINRINHSARDGSVQLERERQTAAALVATIERLTVDAETARIAADAADVGCAAARRSVAECERAEDARQRDARNRDSDATPDTVAAAAAPSAAIDVDAELPEAPATVPFGAPDAAPDDDSELEVAMRAKGPEPAIIRLLRGDRAAFDRLVAELAGSDPAARREWQLAIAGLVDAIVARAIEASILTFPPDHPFWGAYTRPQQRDIAAALSSLGFRFDGLGGWTDDRVPSQRDLSLAVGYAGIDPMRTRRWPTEEETADMFRGVVVAADEYLTGAAGGLTLGEMLSALGRRADALTEIWNEWARLRPLLLASA